MITTRDIMKQILKGVDIIFHQEYYDWKILQTEEELYELVEKLKRTSTLYFDTETSGLRVRYVGEDYIVGWTYAVDDNIDDRVYYVPVRHDFEGEYELGRINLIDLELKRDDFPEFNELTFEGNWHNLDPEFVMDLVRPIFEECYLLNKPRVLVAHNINYDLHVIQNEGIDVLKVFKNNILFDTMVAYHTIDEEGEKKLEEIVRHTYGLKKVDFKLVIKTVTNAEKKTVGLKASQNASFQHVQIPIGGVYSIEDVWFMKQMYPDLIEALKTDEQFDICMEYRMPYISVLWKMERRGMNVDVERCNIMAEKAKIEIDKLSYSIYEHAGVEFNINSTQQLAEILFGVRKKKKNKVTGEYTEGGNDHIISCSFKFQPVAWTDGGKTKDKNLKMPKTGTEVLEELLTQKCTTRGKNALTQLERERQEHEGREMVELLIKYSRLEKLYSSLSANN